VSTGGVTGANGGSATFGGTTGAGGTTDSTEAGGATGGQTTSRLSRPEWLSRGAAARNASCHRLPTGPSTARPG
jgi:hypothetical protein